MMFTSTLLLVGPALLSLALTSGSPDPGSAPTVDSNERVAQEQKASPVRLPPISKPAADDRLMVAPDDPTSPLDNLSAPSPTSYVRANVVLRVDDPDEAMNRLLAEAEAMGGYLSSRDNYAIVLRVPTGQTGAFIAIATELGTVSDRGYMVTDHGAEIGRLDAQIKARRDVLVRYFAVMDGANPSGVITVEREMSNLVSQLETMVGRRRLLMHQLGYSEITVAFRYRDRAGPESSATSSFDWINDMNLGDLLNEFKYDWRYR